MLFVICYFQNAAAAIESLRQIPFTRYGRRPSLRLIGAAYSAISGTYFELSRAYSEISGPLERTQKGRFFARPPRSA